MLFNLDCCEASGDYESFYRHLSEMSERGRQFWDVSCIGTTEIWEEKLDLLKFLLFIRSLLRKFLDNQKVSRYTRLFQVIRTHILFSDAHRVY